MFAKMCFLLVDNLTSVYSVGTRALYCRLVSLGHEAYHTLLHLVLWLRMCGVLPPLHHPPAWHSA